LDMETDSRVWHNGVFGYDLDFRSWNRVGCKNARRTDPGNQSDRPNNDQLQCRAIVMFNVRGLLLYRWLIMVAILVLTFALLLSFGLDKSHDEAPGTGEKLLATKII